MDALSRYVANLEQLDGGDLEIAGGKAANLGELIKAGFAVPAGFAVLTDSYTAATGHLNKAAGAGLRSEIVRANIPEPVAAAIVEAYRELGGGPVAVRSSATAEDLPGATFAGQQDTFLNVLGAANVLDAVRRCWASLWTDRAIAYRRKAGVDPEKVRIAVVVQHLINAETAGVALTANPVTGDRAEIVVNASAGLGEAVVAGLVTPEQFVLDPAGGIRSHQGGRGEIVIRPKLDGGTESAAGGTNVPAMKVTALPELAKVCTEIAAHFGQPQDIEWALAGDKLWIVQARPLTALPPEPIRINKLRAIMTGIVAELLPVRPYPLDMTTWTVHGHGRILTRMLLEMPGLALTIPEMLPESDGVVTQIVPPTPRPTWRTPLTPFRLLPRMLRYRTEVWGQDPRFTSFDQSVGKMTQLPMPELAWPELVALPQRILDVLDDFISLRIDYLPRAALDLMRLRLLLAVTGRKSEFSPLIAADETLTGEANEVLHELARQVSQNAQWREVFLTSTPEELSGRLSRDSSFAPLQARLQEFLAAYGHRETTSAFVVSEPSWNDAPEVFFGAVRALLTSPQGAESENLAEAAERRIAADRRVPNRLRQLIVATGRSARSGIAFREDTHFHASRLHPPLRRALLEVGERLTAAGVLQEPFEVFHLRYEELMAIAEPGTLSAAQREKLRGKVNARRHARERYAGAPLISPLTLRAPATPDDAGLLRGTPAGGGPVSGPVRIIRGPQDFGLLKAGDVMVCPYTNPSWTPLFQLAAAVVVDTGGQASHAAIGAREYGLAAVMGTGTGTATLQNGQQVTVNGTTGVVTLAEQS